MASSRCYDIVRSTGQSFVKRCLSHSLLSCSNGCILIVSPTFKRRKSRLGWSEYKSELRSLTSGLLSDNCRNTRFQLVVCCWQQRFGTSAKQTLCRACCHSFTNVQKTEVWVFLICLSLSHHPLSDFDRCFGCNIGLAVAWTASLAHKLPVLCEFSEHSRCILWSIVTDKCVWYAVSIEIVLQLSYHCFGSCVW